MHVAIAERGVPAPPIEVPVISDAEIPSDLSVPHARATTPARRRVIGRKDPCTTRADLSHLTFSTIPGSI